MINKQIFTRTLKVCTLALGCLLWQCSDDNVVPSSNTTNDVPTQATAVSTSDCGCTYTVPANNNLVDGQTLGLKPGAVICLTSGVAYGNILFRNLKGTATNPIIIKNCGGTVTLNGSGKPYAMKTETSQYFHITGGTGTTYGIKLTSGSLGLTLDKLSSDFEVDHLEIANPGFAGIMAKTDPSCDNATIRGNFVMRNVLLHDNYVHDTGGEGFYVGNSFYNAGVNTSCGLRYPHAIEGLKIYNNVVKNSGWEAIQVGSTPKGSEVYNNRIENYAVKNELYQNNAVQFGEGAPGKFYGNFINGGPGIGVNIIGNGENFIHDNVIVKAGTYAIFCDERNYPGTAGMQFVNNTIINPGKDGIRIYTDLVPLNLVVNNIIVNPGAYSTYTAPRTGNDAYVYVLSKTVKMQMSNNYFTRDINTVKFVNPAAYNYALLSGSPAINKGFNIATFNIPVDYLQQARLKGSAYDIGACEY